MLILLAGCQSTPVGVEFNREQCLALQRRGINTHLLCKKPGRGADLQLSTLAASPPTADPPGDRNPPPPPTPTPPSKPPSKPEPPPSRPPPEPEPPDPPDPPEPPKPEPPKPEKPDKPGGGDTGGPHPEGER